MRHSKLRTKHSRPFRPGGWVILDASSGYLLRYGRRRRVLGRMIYREEGGALGFHDVEAFWASYRLVRYLERNDAHAGPDDWERVPGFSHYLDLAP